MKTPFWLATYDPAIERELFLLGYRNLPVHALGHTGLSLLVATSAWFAAPHSRVLGWLGGMLGLALLFFGGIWAFRHQVDAAVMSPLSLRRWKTANLWMVTLPGAGWGCIGFLYVPEAQVNNLMVMTSFAGAMAYSAVANAYDLRGFIVSVVLATGILLSQIPSAFGDQALVVMGMSLLYLSVMAWVAHNAHATLIDSIQLRLANEILATKNAQNAARAEQANRDKSEFLAAASHDLRQPVHALLLLIEAYRLQVPSAANHPLVQNIALAGQSIGSLFNALMELSRLESGTEQPLLASFDLCESIGRLLTRMHPEADRKKLALRIRCSRQTKNTHVLTDKLLFERLLGNLLANAVRYTEHGGVLLSLRCAHGGNGLWVEVWDTGLGIAPNDQVRIFDPYVQIANRARDRTKGLGLGLAIVRHASELLGLGVSVHSSFERGSRFRVHLPTSVCTTQTLPALHPTEEHHTASPSAPHLTGRRVLLVDDDPMIQHAMQALLSSWGIDLRICSTGDVSALQVCSTDWVPECVLCDFRLPGAQDGIAMLDLIQDRYPHAVGILQTGELVQTVQARAEEAGYLVLFKPVDAAVLATTLNTVLSPYLQSRLA